MIATRGMLIALLLPAALCVAPGCVQRFCVPECAESHDFHEARLPARLEDNPAEFLHSGFPFTEEPSTVLDPERNPRYLTLSEALALALENGTVGSQSIRVPGVPNDDLVAFGGFGVFGSDSIRVLSMQPARAGTSIEAALARFDPLWSTGMNWRGTDEPTQGLSSFSNGQGATFSTTLAKPLATGGVAGIAFLTDYQYLSDPPLGAFPILNPAYTSRLVLGFEQPLLRGSGVEINQILSNFPGSNLFPGINNRSSAFAAEGIVLARLRFDQQRAELERAVNYLLLNVEAAYWNLYGAYANLYITEQGLRQSLLAGRIGKLQLEGGRIDNSQFAQIEAQVEQFRGDRMTALGRVLEAERSLRILLGLRGENNERLIPVDRPHTLPVRPNWSLALHDSLNLRPELVMARQDVKAKHYNLVAQKNTFLPDLRFQANYAVTGLGNRLDGDGFFIDANGNPAPNNSLRSLSSTHFGSWTAGLALNVPIGFRHEHARVRDARLQLAQSYLLLKNQEDKAVTLLTRQYRQVIEGAKVIEIRTAQRKSQARQVEARFRKYDAGIKDSPVEFFLDAQRQWAIALAQEYQAMVDYNVALASFEFARGTLMAHHRISIAEGPLPECGHSCCPERAVDRERQRTHDSVMRITSAPRVIDRASTMWPEDAAVSVLKMAALGVPTTAPDGHVVSPLAPSRPLVGASLLPVIITAEPAAPETPREENQEPRLGDPQPPGENGEGPRQPADPQAGS